MGAAEQYCGKCTSAYPEECAASCPYRAAKRQEECLTCDTLPPSGHVMDGSSWCPMHGTYPCACKHVAFPNPKQAYGDKKTPLHRVPPSLIGYAALGLGEGARKYGPFNWRVDKVELLTYYAALMGHMMAWFEGEEIDPDSGEPHLALAAGSLAILIDATVTGNAIDNRPPASAYRARKNEG